MSGPGTTEAAWRAVARPSRRFQGWLVISSCKEAPSARSTDGASSLGASL